MQPTYTEYYRAVENTAKKLGLKKDQIDKIYRAYTRSLTNKLSLLPFKTITTEEEFNELQVSINLPCLGKIYCDWESFFKRKNRELYDKDKEDKTT